MSKADWMAWTLIACTGCAAGGSTGSTDLDPRSTVTKDPVATEDASSEAGTTAKPMQRDGATDTGTQGMTPDSAVDSMMPPVTEPPNYGTFVVPQLTSAGTGRSAVYKLSLRIGAPQPYGHGAGANHRVSLGTALGR
jgi:hypothetical protein